MLASQSSTGEQKALLIGLILAHARVTSAVSGCPPILLLDEVVAHLDSKRRAELFDQIDTLGIQTWLTGTDIMLFESLRDRAQFFELADGVIRQRESL
jgi:DNA replication and repair protein RecF